MSMRLIASSTIAIGFLAAAAAPQSASAEETHIVEFRFQADELQAPRGAERVYRSLDRKAKSACFTSGRKSLREATLERECYENLVAEFVEKIDDSRLSALHAEENGAAFSARD
jgi:UrcA family protein